MSFQVMLQQLTTGFGSTLVIFFLTLLFSLPLGMVVYFGRVSRFKPLSWIVKAYISIMRGTPLMLQLLLWYFGPFYLWGMNIGGYKFTAIILGCSLNYAAYFAEIYRSGIESIPVGQYEAAPVGKTLVAPAPPEGFTLLDNKDILAANGLYYASWVNGEPQPYENSESKTVDLYDAQLTLVVQENKTEEKAASAVSGWQELAQQNYDISDTQTLTAGGQEYTVIQFTYQDESNPYAFGVAAFGQKGTSAIEWELSCQESYTGDALAVLTEFLNGCTY